MKILDKKFIINNCPHCQINNPNLGEVYHNTFQDSENKQRKTWYIFCCNNCYGLVTVETAINNSKNVIKYFPENDVISEDIPNPAKKYLEEAVKTVHSPSASILVGSRSLNEMLLAIGYEDKNLYNKLQQASEDRKITSEMESWAHEVRLNANEERHPKKYSTEATQEDAKNTIELLKAFAQYLFVLPAMIQKEIKKFTLTVDVIGKGSVKVEVVDDKK